jgi:uncharacterized membrane protein
MAIAETGTESHAAGLNESVRAYAGADLSDFVSKLNFNEKQVVQGLGWFSIGLGLAEIATPGLLSLIIGTKKRPFLMSLFGAREMVTGAGILTSEDPAPWLWARVLGDLMDLSALGAALFAQRKAKLRTLAATAAVAGVTAIDVVCAQKASARPIRLQKTVAINRSPQELYGFLRQFDQYPKFMKRVSSVRMDGGRMLHWEAPGLGGQKLEWDTEITEDRPNELIQWRSVDGSWLQNWGNIRLEESPGGHGTIVKVEMNYKPSGTIATAVATLLGKAPGLQLQEDLRRMKRLLETGEIPTIIGQPSGNPARRKIGEMPGKVQGPA